MCILHNKDKTNHKSPLKLYELEVKNKKITDDATQKKIIVKFQKLYENKFNTNFFTRLLTNIVGARNKKTTTGFYLWGKVGRGKTYLMDLFYNALPIKEKERVHYHSLMQYIHTTLLKLSSCENPIESLANNLIKTKKVICIDELFIDNIADAMIIKNILMKLLNANITIVITSNTHPNNLYENGLQRQHFVAVIEEIKKHLEIVNLDGNVDYRRLKIKKQDLYLTNTTTEYVRICKKLFLEFSLKSIKTNGCIYIVVNERKIKCFKVSKNSIWFDFKEICATPRSKDDYIKIAKNFPVVFLTNVPILETKHTPALRRLIALIDELYEKKTKLIILAEKDIAQLHKSEKLKFEFERTISRVIEMQTVDYLNTKHLENALERT